WLTPLALAVLLVAGGQVMGQDKKPVGFGTLDAASAETVKTQAEAWLKATGKMDGGMSDQFETIWKQTDRPVLDRLADTFGLGNAEAAKLMAEARDLTGPAPSAVPTLIKDDKQSEFFRANFGLAYARALNNRRVHEEALDVLKLFRAEQVVDPAAYLFNRAVSEYSLLSKEDANRTIRRLLDEAGTFS